MHAPRKGWKSDTGENDPTQERTFLNLVLQGRSEVTQSEAGGGAAGGSIISGGTSTPQFAAKGRRTPRKHVPDADASTPNSKVQHACDIIRHITE